MVTKSAGSALIVAKPGPLQESLGAMLMTIPQIETVSLICDAPSALRRATDRPPTLVLLDADSPDDEIWSVAKLLMAEWPEAVCIVLVDNEEEYQAAEAFGADKVLFKGFPAEKLFETIERLVPEQET